MDFVSENMLELLHDDLKKVAEIGRGAFGVVYKYTNGAQNVAVKKIKGLSIDLEVMLRTEIKAMKKLSPHANIVQFYGYRPTRNGLFIYMELCESDLKRYMTTSNANVDHRGQLDIMLQIINGVRFMHSNKIIHRDLKPQNVLVKLNKSEFGKDVFKLADFGMAKIKEAAINTMSLSLSAVGGTPTFTAPEIILARMSGEAKIPAKQNPFAVDIFPLGIVCYWILTLETPFNELQLIQDDFDPCDVVRGNIHAKINDKWSESVMKSRGFTGKAA